MSPSDEDVVFRIKKSELQLHCRRTTGGVKECTWLLKELLTTFDGDAGKDTLGVPLLNSEKTWLVWESQVRHIACIQDLEDFQLYRQTGTRVKGGITLPMYRCARGSTSRVVSQPHCQIHSRQVFEQHRI